jgi:transcriptional regulator with XRE-family HTH domain
MLEVGKKIKELRQSKKLTQKSLAETLNVTPQAISKWERNESNPDIQTLLKLSDYFNVTVDEILGKRNKTFFDSLFFRMKGSKPMGNVNDKITEQLFEKQNERKKVVIFDIVFSFISDKGILQTQLLERKLDKLLKKENKETIIETYNSTKVDQYGWEADVILLTPTFGYAKEEIEKKFPETLVIEISKKDYGTLNVDILSDKIATYLR